MTKSFYPKLHRWTVQPPAVLLSHDHRHRLKDHRYRRDGHTLNLLRHDHNSQRLRSSPPHAQIGGIVGLIVQVGSSCSRSLSTTSSHRRRSTSSNSRRSTP